MAARAKLRPFAMRVAGLTCRVTPRHPDVGRLCTPYMIDGDHTAFACDIELAVSEADIAAERALASEEGPWTDGYLETLAVLRQLAEHLPHVNRLLLHAAAFEYDGRAYLLCAPSGTGKSTHMRLWRRHVGPGVRVINGDKPIVELQKDAAPLVHGTPWAGKEGWHCNMSAPLAGICFLSRAAQGENRLVPLSPADALSQLARQVFLPHESRAAVRTLELMDCLLAKVPLYALACDMSEDAVRVSFEGLTGGRYEGRGA